MAMLRIFLDVWNFEFEGQISGAIMVSIIGLVILLVSGYQFRKASTTVHPLKPDESSSLVTSGIYRFSRNPMYIGFLLLLLAWGLILGSALAFLVLPFFIVLITNVQITPEESVLLKRFGEEYINYKKKVRRWI